MLQWQLDTFHYVAPTSHKWVFFNYVRNLYFVLKTHPAPPNQRQNLLKESSSMGTSSAEKFIFPHLQHRLKAHSKV